LKRIALAAAVAVAMLVGASSAFAAINNYSATYKFMGKSGKGAPLSFQQIIKATPATAGSRTGLLKTIQTTISGVNVNVKGFPTCSVSDIANAATFDKACDPKALVAKGAITAQLGPPPLTAPATGPCNPHLDVWNAGKGKLTFFFVADSSGAHACLGGQVHTGAVAPWTASYKQVGPNLSVTIPIPSSVDEPVPGLLGSLQTETLLWKSQTVKGVSDITSSSCSGKRKYTWSFSAGLTYTGAQEVKKYSGAASCG
jgi:hypothetical protein